ncbi:MAG: lipocalin family protein [Chitinophagaceae bacterium]
MKKLLLFSLVAGMGLSCKKNDSCSTNAGSVAGPYRITAYAYKSSSSATEVDYYNVIFSDPCDRDDIYTFNSNGTYHITDAGTVCSPPNTDDGTWALSGNTMTIDGEPGTIQSFDCHTLVVVIADTQVAGDQLKITLVKQ